MWQDPWRWHISVRWHVGSTCSHLPRTSKTQAHGILHFCQKGLVQTSYSQYRPVVSIYADQGLRRAFLGLGEHRHPPWRRSLHPIRPQQWRRISWSLQIACDTLQHGPMCHTCRVASEHSFKLRESPNQRESHGFPWLRFNRKLYQPKKNRDENQSKKYVMVK